MVNIFMKATEIIRDLLDLIDKIDSQENHAENSIELEPIVTVNDVEDTVYDDGPRRFKQIFDILSSEPVQMYDNSPGIAIADINSVTRDAGGGLNGPKHPSDIRADSVSMYPFHQHNPGV